MQQAGAAWQKTLQHQCAVCRIEPLVFQECPHCQARYCASGCLQSWYEHKKPSRAPALKVRVNSSEENYILAKFPGAEGYSAIETEIAICRIAGGLVIADVPGEKSGTRKRWGLASVDGWVLGQPGPGPDWRPSKGVTLTLEEIGQLPRLPDGACRARVHLQ